jgi:hypothetical protein
VENLNDAGSGAESTIPSALQAATDEDISSAGSDAEIDQEGSDVEIDEDQEVPEALLEAPEDEQDLNHFMEQYTATAFRHKVSIAAAGALLEIVVQYRPLLSQEGVLRSYRGSLRRKRKMLPVPKQDVYVWDRHAKVMIVEKGLEEYPRNKYVDKALYEPVMVRTYFTIATLTQFSKKIHRNSTTQPDFETIQLSIDGVQESKSTAYSLEVVSLRHRGCQKIWPLSVLRLTAKDHLSLDAELILRPIIDEIKELQLRVDFIVADKPERSLLRNQKGHSAFLGCDFCTAFGNKKSKGKKGGTVDNPENVNTGVFYPLQDVPPTLRHWENVRDILTDYDAREAADKSRYQESLLGYKGYTPVLELCIPPHDLDFFRDISAEYMHCICLGVIKQLYDKCIKNARNYNFPRGLLGSVKPRLTEMMSRQKLPSCFSRRARSDFSQFKASEWRNIGLIFFPLLVQSMPGRLLRPRRQLWLLLGYLFRAHMLDDTKFQALQEVRARQNRKTLMEVSRQFAKVARQEFTDAFLTYNVHVFTEHLTWMRERRPFTECSAFEFESSYANLLGSFTAGTTSIGKQALQNLLLLASTERHRCLASFGRLPGLRETSCTTDRLVVTRTGQFFKLISLADDINGGNDQFLAVEIKLGTYSPEGCPEDIKDFSNVEVYTYLGESETETRLLRQDLSTFAVKLDLHPDINLILSVPVDTLLQS